MDLLSSILNSMDKPPVINSHQNQAIRKQKQQLEKEQANQKAKLKVFREKIEKKVNEFIKDESQKKYPFEPMDKVLRTIVHDVADIAGLSAFSFGEDGVDRHVMIFKKEFAPCDDELAAYRKGEEWNPESAKKIAELKEQMKQEEKEQVDISRKRKACSSSNAKYQEKYEKLLGKDAGKAAARIATPNKQFGFVPSEQKKDQRSIEQTLADLRAKKKLKTEATQSAASSTLDQSTTSEET